MTAGSAAVALTWNPAGRAAGPRWPVPSPQGFLVPLGDSYPGAEITGWLYLVAGGSDLQPRAEVRFGRGALTVGGRVVPKHRRSEVEPSLALGAPAEPAEFWPEPIGYDG